jgi:hypothetical protein
VTCNSLIFVVEAAVGFSVGFSVCFSVITDLVAIVVTSSELLLLLLSLSSSPSRLIDPSSMDFLTYIQESLIFNNIGWKKLNFE